MKRTLDMTINRSKREKNDEYYTRLADIESVMRHNHTVLGRPISRNDDAVAYNARGEVTSATVASNVASYVYDAFYNLLSAADPMADVFFHRFSTKYFDPETGLYYYGYRFYSPELGRWINRDPIEEEGWLAFPPASPLLHSPPEPNHTTGATPHLI